MKKYELPTYPINPGMVLGRRGEDELVWLLDRGVIQSDLYQYLLIRKLVDGLYQLYKNQDNRYTQEDQPIGDPGSLSLILSYCQEHNIDLARWYWYELDSF